MDVSIIFVNYKTKELTINAINSVIEKTKEISYEIFVVDNNSQDGSIEAIEEQFPDISIIKSPKNGGFGYANNLAIKHAKGKYIFCLNTDTLLVNNAIKIMFDFMEQDENKNVGVCGGFLVDKENNPILCGGNFPSIMEVLFKCGLRNIFPKEYKKYSVILKSDDEEYIENIDYITGADIFFRKSVLDEVGIFDEKFFMYYEETDLCKRIKNSGYGIKFVSAAKIIHLEGQSNNNSNKMFNYLKTSEFYYFRKHYLHKVVIIKLIYFVLYLTDWLILKNKKSLELLKLVLSL